MPPAFAWDSPTTTDPSLSSTDDLEIQVELPWPFAFFDEKFRYLRVSTNGYVRLFYGWYLDGDLDCQGQSSIGPWPCDPIPEANPVCGACYQFSQFLDHGQPLAPDYVIAPWWNDWRPDLGGTVSHGRFDAGTSSDRFVVAWNDVAGPGGVGTYSFQVKLFKDGRIEFHYKKVSQQGSSAPSDFGRRGSVGFQPRRGAHYADSVFFCQAVTTAECPVVPLPASSALRFDPDTTQRPESGTGDPDVPTIVQDFAPDFYLDYSDNGTCDTAVTKVNFDGDFCGANNNFLPWVPPGGAPQCIAIPAGQQAAALTHVYYSLSETQTHYFIGYYLYHQRDCTGGWGGGHEHDVEGVNVAVRKDLMRIEAAFTNVHGHKVSYVPVYEATDILDTDPGYGSQHTRHLTFVPSTPRAGTRVWLSAWRRARTRSGDAGTSVASSAGTARPAAAAASRAATV